MAVNFSVSVVPPSTGTPTGTVTVSDGVDSCTASVADGTCSLTLTTVGNHDLTATYAGNTNYDGSVSATEPHVVDGPPGVNWIDSVADTGDSRINPTWEGNTVLTAHNYTPDGLAGPFALINDLKYDEPIIIHNNGLRYTYLVRLNTTVTAKDSYLLNKHEQLDWVTLITCAQYEEKSNSYLLRQVVRAVLTSVESDNITEGQ